MSISEVKADTIEAVSSQPTDTPYASTENLQVFAPAHDTLESTKRTADFHFSNGVPQKTLTRMPEDANPQKLHSKFESQQQTPHLQCIQLQTPSSASFDEGPANPADLL